MSASPQCLQTAHVLVVAKFQLLGRIRLKSAVLHSYVLSQDYMVIVHDIVAVYEKQSLPLLDFFQTTAVKVAITSGGQLVLSQSKGSTQMVFYHLAEDA